MNIFATKQRIRIIRRIVFKEVLPGVNSLAKELKLSKGLVSVYLGALCRQGILRKSRGKYEITPTPMTKAVRIFFNLSLFHPSLFRTFRFIQAAGLYGSAAHGDNTEESDIDVWIKTDTAPDQELARLTGSLNKKIRNIKILLLDDKRVERLKQTDRNFYHSLVFGSILLYGNAHAI